MRNNVFVPSVRVRVGSKTTAVVPSRCANGYVPTAGDDKSYLYFNVLGSLLVEVASSC